MSTPRQQLEERGWTVFPSVVEPSRGRELLAELERIWSGLGRPPLYSRSDVPYGEDIVVSAVGMAVHRILDRIPGIRDHLLPHAVVDVVRSILGEDFRLLLASAILTDQTRPFFLWHHLVARLVDARDYLKQPVRYPRFERIERLSCTFYPVPLDEDHGVMLVHPRRVADATEPPYPELESPWPVQETVRCPAGSIVLADQSLWHAVTPMGSEGRRAFAACFLVRNAS